MMSQTNDMQLLKKFLQFIADNRLFERTDRILVAVSGGMDSVCLAHLCKAAGFSFGIAHVNFNLRGDESEGDENFVGDLAKEFNVPFHCTTLDAARYSKESKVSVQVAARELRYDFFRDIMASHYYKRLLTAHHADDNAETMLMNFLKGTGINGMRGILPLNGNICRPLLFAPRELISAYAKESSIDFREDSSNATDKYTRNRIRLEVFPSLAKAYPQFRENLYNNAARFREISSLYQDAVDRKMKKMVVKEEGELKIPVLALLKSGAAATLLFELLQPLGFKAAQLPEAMKLLHTESGKFIESESHRLLRNRKWLIAASRDTLIQSAIIIESTPAIIHYAGGSLDFRTDGSTGLAADADIAELDASAIEFPLILRRWKTGDYFYPLGMRHKKKLSRFFIDQKLSLYDKEKIWVLESNKRILWVVGIRIDDRFKVTTNTRNKLRIVLTAK